MRIMRHEIKNENGDYSNVWVSMANYKVILVLHIIARIL